MVEIVLSEVDEIDELRDGYRDLDKDDPFDEWAQRMLEEEIDRVGRDDETPVEEWAETILRRDIRARRILGSWDALTGPQK